MHWLIIFILFFLQFFLILTTNINIAPEHIHWAWLVRNGQVPYRDFLSNHGPLLDYLMAPLMYDKTLFPVKVFYVLIQSTNLFFVLYILRKTTNIAGVVLGGLLYVLLNFYISDNNLWEEIVITTFYLVTYAFIIQKKDDRISFLIGFLIACASLLKPTAAIILLPVLYIKRDWRIFGGFVSSWIVICIYFLIRGGLWQMIDSVFLYNRFYGAYFLSHLGFYIEKSMSIGILCMMFGAFVLSILNKSFNKKVELIFLTITSLFFIVPGFSKVNLPPFIAFFIIYLASFLHDKRHTRYLTVFVIILFTLFVARKVKHQYAYLHTNRTPYIELPVIQSITKGFARYSLNDKKIFIYGNEGQLYFLFDAVPHIYHTFFLPFMNTYFTKAEKITIKDIHNANVQYIIEPLATHDYQKSFPHIRTYIKQYFILVDQTPSAKLYKRRGVH